MNLLLLEFADFIDDNHVRLSDRRHEQIRKVLRAAPGKLCKAGLLNGPVGTAEVLEITDEATLLKTDLHTNPPPPLELTLAAALPRPQTFDKVLRCGTEMGIKKFHFFMSRKVEKSYWQSPVLQPDHIRYEFKLALEQCGDTIEPQVWFHPLFKPFVEDELEAIIGDGRAFVGHPLAAEALPVKVPDPVTLLLGPEGGFTDYEIALLSAHKVTPVTLGSRTLRTEHALPALIATLK